MLSVISAILPAAAFTSIPTFTFHSSTAMAKERLTLGKGNENALAF